MGVQLAGWNSTSVGIVMCSLPNTPGIYIQEQITAWADVVKAVKETGNVFFLQLWHAGRSGHSGTPPTLLQANVQLFCDSWFLRLCLL